MDYYKVLGLDSTATKQDIRAAYRKLAFQYHPDRNSGDERAADMMKQVNEAYAVLSDDKKKQNYDAMKTRYGDTAYDQFRGKYSEHDIFSGSDIKGIFEELAKDFGFRNFDELFSEAYGSFRFSGKGGFARGFVFFGPRSRRNPDRGDQVETDAARRGFLSSIINKIGILNSPKAGKDRHDKITLPRELALEGGPYAYLIQETGTKLMVKIPPGVREGQKIRLAGMGKAGAHGGPAGDLYLKVSIERSLVQNIKHYSSKIRSFFNSFR